jgi:hypothetical protein
MRIRRGHAGSRSLRAAPPLSALVRLEPLDGGAHWRATGAESAPIRRCRRRRGDNAPVNGNQSPWADEERWRERLDADGLRVAELLDADDREVVEGAVAAAAVNHALDFLVVYGSVARGERHADSDLDLYFEARDLPREVNLTDEGRRWHASAAPPCADPQPRESDRYCCRSSAPTEKTPQARSRPSRAARVRACGLKTSSPIATLHTHAHSARSAHRNPGGSVPAHARGGPMPVIPASSVCTSRLCVRPSGERGRRLRNGPQAGVSPWA